MPTDRTQTPLAITGWMEEEEGSEQKGLIGCESREELSAGGGGSTLKF